MVCVAVALVGCKSSDGTREAREALAKMLELTDSMCRCTDRICADKVQEEMTLWAQQMAKKGDRSAKPDEALMKQMVEVGTRYAECMTAAMSPSTTPPSEPAAKPPLETPIPDIVPISTPDALIAQAYRTASADVFVSKIELRYITATGTFDPKYSEATITMSRRPKPEPPDDPARPTGAPVREPTRSLDEMLAEVRCPQLRWSEHGAAADEAACGGAVPLERPRCTVAAVAKRALTSGAPDKALAVIVLDGGDKPGKRPRWLVTIDDPRRRVHFETHVADDCEVVVEKP